MSPPPDIGHEQDVEVPDLVVELERSGALPAR